MKGAAVVKAINAQAESIVDAINNIDFSIAAAKPYDDSDLAARLESINSNIYIIGNMLCDLTTELKRGNDMRERRDQTREKRRKIKLTQY